MPVPPCRLPLAALGVLLILACHGGREAGVQPGTPVPGVAAPSALAAGTLTLPVPPVVYQRSNLPPYTGTVTLNDGTVMPFSFRLI